MSAHNPTLTTDRSRHRRDNWFGDADTADDDRDAGHTRMSDAETHAALNKDRTAWIAKSILKHGARFICPIALFEDADDELALHDGNVEIEVSDPTFYVRENDDQLTTAYGLWQRRVNAEHGYLSSGCIADRPREEFVERAEEVAAIAAAQDRIRPEEQQLIVDAADRMKRRGHLRDVRIMDKLVQAIEFDGGVAEFMGDA